MRVIVCGGRNYADGKRLRRILDDMPVSKVITGAATGADQLAVEWARARGIEAVEYPADWDRFGNEAGPIRNRKMLDEEKPDWVLAFPGGKGTANMVRQAKERGVEVHEVAA